ncbi:MAG: hypothetical protein WC197_09085 [Candidatus Gastranaerophilaceae bacterium]|jgi:hypothetical protein
MSFDMTIAKELIIDETCVEGQSSCQHLCICKFTDGKIDQKMLDITKISALLHAIDDDRLPVTVNKKVTIQGVEETKLFQFWINFNHYYFPKPSQPCTLRTVFNFFWGSTF